MKRKKVKHKPKMVEEKIIEFIKAHPYCSRDSIFTKGKIPKSKANIDLINNLVSQKKIHVTGTSKKKYYVGEMEALLELKQFYKDFIYKCEKEDSYTEFSLKLIEFLKTRIKVIESERHNGKINFGDTFYIILIFFKIRDNLTKSGEYFLLNLLNYAIRDDKYYLKHQSHSRTKEKASKYDKSKKVSARKSLSNLLDMQKKGRHEYGLERNSDLNYHMKILTDNPTNWFNRFFAEDGRALYKNHPDLLMEIYKEITDAKKLKRNDPQYKIKKEFLDVAKKFFPKVSQASVFEILPNMKNKIGKQLVKDKFDSAIESSILNVIEKALREHELRKMAMILKHV
ncbi:MAG: hypothetical protein ACREAK_07915 [Nitrosarchaeum sp.]